ncbi:hypothetical protein [Thomasclavelia cocleata]|jgi:lactaldehyde reductase|nr:hypothetical protein [Thomasclavelia cocleata]
MKNAEKMNEMLYVKVEDEYIAFIERLKKLSQDVGIPKDLKEIVKIEDLDFLSQSAFGDVCRPSNSREISVVKIKELYKSLL